MEEPITGAKTFPEPEFPELATGTLPPAVLPDLMLALAEAMAFPAAGTGVLLVATDEVFPATIAELVLVPAEERPLPLPAAAICVLAPPKLLRPVPPTLTPLLVPPPTTLIPPPLLFTVPGPEFNTLWLCPVLVPTALCEARA